MRAHELMEVNTTGFQLFIDLDGVLVDLIGGIRKMMQDPQFDLDNKKDSNNFWRYLQRISRNEAIEFWADLDWAPGGKELWKYVSRFDAAILSSPGHTLRDIIEAGKIKWIKKNLKSAPSRTILTPDKYKHAHQFAILIDDKPKNIIPWEEKGGVGILYKTGQYKPAIKELQDRFGFPK